MDVRRSGRSLACCTLCLGLLAGAGGCQSTSPLSAMMERVGNPFARQNSPQTAKINAKTMPLVQGMEITWNVKPAAKEEPGLVSAGKSVIGPDGTIELGPYGACKIAGMNINQAAQKVEKHLSAYLTKPGVRLSTVAPANAEDLAWRPVGEGGILARTTTPGHAKKNDAGGTRQVDYQVTEPKDEAPVLQNPGQAIQPVGRKQRVYQHGGMPVQAGPMVPVAPGEMSRVLMPAYVIGQPDVLQIESLKGLLNQPVKGPHLVRPDGTVGIGAYGSALVAGMTIDQAREEIAKVIHSRLNKDVVKLQEVLEGLSVDVLAYNSKVYYVITDGGGYGEQVVRLPFTGNENVLDAISMINGLPAVASKKHIWVARSNPGMGGHEATLPVDWIGITQRAAAATNYQILPGDRVYVQADRWRTADAFLAKILAPVERILGVTLLGSQTVNSIKSGSTGVR